MTPKYRLLAADKSKVRWLLQWFAPLDKFWMTYRLPGQRLATITYPPGTQDPEGSKVVAHELHHVDQFAPWWGPWWCAVLLVLPLPVLLSGRWFLERGAYLADIQCGDRTVEQAVETLWHGYGWCWPKPWMRRWFEARKGKL